MTMEQATDLARRAAESGDLEALETAMKARACAIAALIKAPASEELAAQLRSAIEDGEQIGPALRALKQRIGFECARLSQLQSGLTTGIGPNPASRIDYRG